MSQQASIFNQNGVAPTSFAGVQQPWHRVWNKLSEEASRDFGAAMVAGDIAWDVKKAALPNPFTGKPTSVFGIFRDDTNDLIGSGKAGYEPISNGKALKFLTDIIGENKDITIDSCGCFEGGSKVFVNLHVGTVDVLPGDAVELYYQFVTAHDGSLQLVVFMSGTRIVCSNTARLAMALAQAKLKIKHTAGAVSKMENVAEWLALAQQEQKSFGDKMKFLATKHTTRGFEEIYLDNLLGKAEPKFKKDGLAEKETRRIKLRKMILSADGASSVKGVEGTAWGLFNQVTQTYDHLLVNNAHAKPGLTKEQSHAISASFGSMANMKTKAFDTLVEMAKSL